jgi:hypothetical protein
MRHGVALFLMSAVFVACDGNDKSPTEPADQPLASQSKAFRAPTIKVQPNEANLDLAAASAPRHDPKLVGMRVRCFSGTTDGDQGGVTFGGTCQRTTQDNLDLAEINTTDGDPDGSYAGVWAVPIQIKGKRLGDVIELSFQYAGGPPGGGSPRWSVAIDENANGKHDGDEAFAFADVNACNDGDSFVGTEDGEDDGSCQWFYKAESFPNWDAFAGAHPTYRIPRLTESGAAIVPAFVVMDQPGHYLIFKLDVR